MASLSSTKRNGKRCFQIWIGSEPNRRNLWLGSVSKTRANEILSNVIQLEAASESNTQLNKGTKEWLSAVEDRFHAKLVKVGIAKPRASETVKAFFAERLKSLKCSTRTHDIYQRAHKKFYDFINEDLNIRDITPKMAHDFYNVHLLKTIKAPSYRAKTAKIVREYFDKAVLFELIDKNPFAGFEITSDADRSRHAFIDRQSIIQIIKKGPDVRWRCLLGFAGLCGLRTRSEIAELKWEDIHWDDDTFTVPAVKTKERTVPIFGDFRQMLEAYHQNVIGTDMQTIAAGLIFPNCPSQTQLTKRLNRTIAKAGMQPWVKPWMNLRSSVESHLILIEGFDIETVCKWLGNSPDVARKHYLQTTPAEIAKASAIGQKFSNSFQTGGATDRENPENPAFCIAKERGKAIKYTREDSNLQPSVPKTDALSN